ncbi:MAG: nucleotidyltransferase family protein [Actinomycetota bacterium]|nr:nucleotidyltransferase family protein [Actinomycetota bacterium]
MKVAGLLLAAGAGSRMGQPKALVRLDGEPLVRRGIRLLRDGGCSSVTVVLGAAADEVIAQGRLTDVDLCHNVDWADGMGSSLRAGLAALPADAEATLVALVDQPLVGAEAVRRLLAAGADGAVAAVATYEGRRRNPVLLARALWPAVAEAAVGEAGARTYLRSHPELVTPVECADTGSADDVDTPEDLRLLPVPTHPQPAR